MECAKLLSEDPFFLPKNVRLKVCSIFTINFELDKWSNQWAYTWTLSPWIGTWKFFDSKCMPTSNVYLTNRSWLQVARIRFRTPDGEMFQRRFRANDKLSSVLDFITSEGYFPDDYKLLSSWPRRDLTGESVDKTLDELKLYPQETLTLEQRWWAHVWLLPGSYIIEPGSSYQLTLSKHLFNKDCINSSVRSQILFCWHFCLFIRSISLYSRNKWCSIEWDVRYKEKITFYWYFENNGNNNSNK